MSLTTSSRCKSSLFLLVLSLCIGLTIEMKGEPLRLRCHRQKGLIDFLEECPLLFVADHQESKSDTDCKGT